MTLTDIVVGICILFLFTIMFIWVRTEYIMDMIRDWKKEWRNK
jgi:hypothetical protein